jgi:CRP-like cAMP-binding protein
MNPGNYTYCDPETEDIRKAFSFLSSEEAEELCSYMELRELQADAVVMEEGASEDHVGFLIEGKLAVKKKTGYWGKHIIIAILEKGAMVGEGGFITLHQTYQTYAVYHEYTIKKGERSHF